MLYSEKSGAGFQLVKITTRMRKRGIERGKVRSIAYGFVDLAATQLVTGTSCHRVIVQGLI